MVVHEADWAGLVAGRVDPTEAVELKAWAGEIGAGGAQALKAIDATGDRWWVKPITNNQGAMVTVTEYLIGRLGTLIGAPTCAVSVVVIPADLETPQHPAGFAHGHVTSPELSRFAARICRIAETTTIRTAMSALWLSGIGAGEMILSGSSTSPMIAVRTPTTMGSFCHLAGKAGLPITCATMSINHTT